MLLEPNQTPYDVRFRLFGVPVRIHPLYWIVTAIFTFPHGGTPVEMWPILMAIVFVSLMVHELGHVLAFQRYRIRAGVVLWGFGGLAVADAAPPRMGQRIFICLAGPGAGFVFAALIWASNEATSWRSTSAVTRHMYWALMFINIVWGAVNLLPVWPLDGGRVSEEICRQKRPYNGFALALKISFVVAVIVAVYGVLTEYVIPEIPLGGFLTIPGGLYVGVLFAMLAIFNFQMLQQITRGYRGGYSDDRLPWER